MYIPVDIYTDGCREPGKASLAINNSSSNTTLTVGLTGVGASLLLTVSPTSLSFSAVTTTTTATQMVTVKNTGTLSVTISGVAISGTNAGDYAVASAGTTCGTSLAAGASCTYQVAFTPAVVGVRTATLTISNSSFSAMLAVALAGEGISLVPTFSPTTLDFGTFTTGLTTPPLTVTMSNPGTSTVNITWASIPGKSSPAQFTLVSGLATNCGASLASGASCTYQVTFTPSGTGTETSALTITTDSLLQNLYVGLTGQGGTPMPGPLTLSVTSLDL